MTSRVLDASALTHALIGKTRDAANLRNVLRHTECHAPHLIDAELGNVLRKRVRGNEVTPHQAHTALHEAHSVIDYRYPHTGALAELAWTWRDNLTFYDALYVALAVRLDVPLMTGDRRLAGAPGIPCAIELI